MLKHGVLFAFGIAAIGFAAAGVPTVDGVVTDMEYAHMYHDEKIGMMLRWEAVGDVMYICMEAPATGWIGLSFMPMDGTIHGDTVIGYVNADTQEAFLSDQVAPGNAHFPHFDDRRFGGETSFLEVVGSEVGGRTVIEFSRALMTGEPTDAPFMDMGLMTMISFHPTADDYVSYHSKWYNVVTINYVSGEVGDAMDMSHTGSHDE